MSNKIPALIEDLKIISKLGDTPGVDNNLSTDQLKAKFDEAAEIIKAYLNTYVVTAINEYVASTDGLLNLNGGTMKGNIDMNGNKITNIPSPSASTDPANKSYTDAENQRYLETGKKYANNLIVVGNNLFVPQSSFQEVSGKGDFKYQAAVPVAGFDVNVVPSVAFSIPDVASGIFSSVCESYNGGVYIYATERPGTAITIPTIVGWRYVR